MSFCVIVSAGSPSESTYENVRPSATIRGDRAASAPSIVPSVVRTPARWSSAIASMIPEPQTPVTCVPAKPGLVRPDLGADHAVARLERLRVDPHALDRARRGALAAADLRALEGRAGRARGREEAVAVAEHDLGVRADVDDQVDLVAEVRRLGEDHARRVGPDVPGDAGQHVGARAGVHRQAELDGGPRARPRRSRARRAPRRARSGRGRARGGA